MPVIFRIRYNREFTQRELQALNSVKRIVLHITFDNAYKKLDNQPTEFPWTSQLAEVLTPRLNIHTFEFRGYGRRIVLPSAVANVDPKYLSRLKRRFIKIIAVLGNLPVVAATHAVRIRWAGDDHLKRGDNEDWDMYCETIDTLRSLVGLRQA